MKHIKHSAIFLALALILPGCYMMKKSESYYGIDTGDSKKFVFLVDISGSMEGKAETDLQGNVVAEASRAAADKVGGAVGGVAGNLIRSQTREQLTKLGKARKELIPAIRGLSEDSRFTVVTFENRIGMWMQELKPATPANKNLAIAFINQLESGGGTNIYGSLEKAFELAGEGARDPDKEPGVETIFLLSDGEPSSGKVTSNSGILQAIRDWNPKKRIRIHTIGLGEDCDKDFMQSISDENGGQFIDR